MLLFYVKMYLKKRIYALLITVQVDFCLEKLSFADIGDFVYSQFIFVNLITHIWIFMNLITRIWIFVNLIMRIWIFVNLVTRIWIFVNVKNCTVL